jgi:hypothetical protein
MDRFRGDGAVEALEGYGLLARLLEEQCEIVKEPVRAAEGDADVNEPPVPVVVKPAKEVRSDSLQTPHDASLTYSGKKGKGEEVQVAETCGNGEKPEVITYAEVTRSCESDEKATVPVVDDLASRGMAPTELLADTGYGSTENAMALEERGVELVAPVAGPKVEVEAAEMTAGKDEAKEATAPEAMEEPAPAEDPVAVPAGGARPIPKAEFDVDPKGERATRCPNMCEAVEERRDAGTGAVRAVFAGDTCAVCPFAARCPAKRQRDGTRVLKTTVHAAVLAGRRRYERTGEFRQRYAARAGIEATNSELKRAHGLGRLRIRGFLRVRLAVHLKALACNVKRMVKYLVGQGRKAAESVAAAAQGAAEGAAEGAASSLRVILTGIRAGFAKVTGWWRIVRRGSARVGPVAAAPAA